MRLCLVTSFPPSHGRLSEYAHFLTKALQRVDSISHIDVIADYEKPSYVGEKVTVHRLWRPDDPVSVFKIIFAIMRLRPDVVCFNVSFGSFGGRRPANFVGLILPFLCRVLGFRSVVNVHNLIESMDSEILDFKLNPINRLGTLIATKALALSSLVIVISLSYVKLLKTRYRCKNVVYIPHGTIAVPLTANPHGVSNSKTILCMGYHSPRMNLELLFDAFKQVSLYKDVRLIVAGESHPHYPGFLEKYHSINLPNVLFTGYLPEDRLFNLYREVDVVVLPYRTCTGASGVAHLSFSFGIPVIATDLPEFRELKHQGAGVILTPQDPLALAREICRVLDDPDLVRRLRERSLRFSEERTWDKIAQRFYGVFSEKVQTPL